MKKSLLIVSFVLLFVSEALAKEVRNEWDEANIQTTRLLPSTFSQLPINIINELQRQNYTIPQCYDEKEPHNVISGEFIKKGQKDWAVLASKDLQSTIIVFWNGSVSKVSKIASKPDKNYLQGIGNGNIGYSRRISVVDKEYIIEHFNRYGGVKPPPIEHEGINDLFIYKASVVHYFNNKWIKLTGAD
jgi:hypothetical protein